MFPWPGLCTWQQKGPSKPSLAKLSTGGSWWSDLELLALGPDASAPILLCRRLWPIPNFWKSLSESASHPQSHHHLTLQMPAVQALGWLASGEPVRVEEDDLGQEAEQGQLEGQRQN